MHIWGTFVSSNKWFSPCNHHDCRFNFLKCQTIYSVFHFVSFSHPWILTTLSIISLYPLIIPSTWSIFKSFLYFLSTVLLAAFSSGLLNPQTAHGTRICFSILFLLPIWPLCHPFPHSTYFAVSVIHRIIIW